MCASLSSITFETSQPISIRLERRVEVSTFLTFFYPPPPPQISKWNAKRKKVTISSEGKPDSTDVLYILCGSSQFAVCLMCGFMCDDCRSQDLLWCSEKALRALSWIRPGFISSTVDRGLFCFVLFLNESRYSQVSI